MRELIHMIAHKYLPQLNWLKLCALLVFISCDDGDLNIPAFDFETSVSNCGDLTLFKLNENESIALVINADNSDNAFLNTVRDQEIIAVSEISYRTFTDKPTASYFCQSIPPTTPTLLETWTGTGQLIINTTYDQIDTDEIEELDLLKNSDGDAFPDYIDSDDDNDGILSKNELDEDSDGDGLMNYLDDDDDNDGVPTLNESINGDIDGDDIPDYLDADTTVSNTARTVTNSYVQTYKNDFTINLLKLVNSNGNPIQIDSYYFGTKTTTNTVID